MQILQVFFDVDRNLEGFNLATFDEESVKSKYSEYKEENSMKSSIYRKW